jgi:sirohydrochlorin cobaltochelatase
LFEVSVASSKLTIPEIGTIFDIEPGAGAVLVVFHGSHDAQYQRSVQEFLVQLGQACRTLGMLGTIEAAFLDCVPEPLHQQIQDFAQQAFVAPRSTDRSKLLQILPLFLLPGMHVMEDIPTEIGLAQAALEDQVEIQVLPYLGSLPILAQTLGNCFSPDPRIGRIVISHGSRRSGGNQPVEALAQELNALSAFWSVQPDLATQVADLSDRLLPVEEREGLRQIEVLPYFLFEGSMSAGIAQQLHDMIQKWPDLKIKLLPTLTQQPGLIEVVAQELIKSFRLASS